MAYICLSCVDHELQPVAGEGPDVLLCPGCGRVHSASDLAARERKALQNFKDFSRFGVPTLLRGTESVYVPSQILAAIEEDRRKHMAQCGTTEAGRKTKQLGKILDPGVISTLTQQLSKRDIVITVRGMEAVPAAQLRDAIFLYYSHLIATGRLQR